MNRIARFFVALSLILAAPGLAPYQAAAQTMGAARVVVPVGPIGASGASFNALGGSASILPAASLQAGLVPSFAPSVTPAPILGAAFAAPAANVSVIPVSLNPSIVPASDSPQANRPGAVTALRSGAVALSAASKDAPAESPRAALDGLFEGSVSLSALRAESLPVISAPSDAPRLDPSQPAKGPRWVKTLRTPDGAPKTSLKRTMSVGFLAAVVPIAFTMIAVGVAQLFGHELHPNYKGPDGTDTASMLQAIAIWIGAAVMAPISEEALFRGGLQGFLSKISAKIRLGAFILPALLTSGIFVALHETSDPVLFGTRFVHAMVLSYVYQKEGILASMAAHGFFNGLLAVSIILSAAGMPWLGLAVVPLALVFALRSARFLRKQKPDMASGAVIPKPMTAAMATAFAAILGIGYFFLMPNIFWAIGAVMLIVAAVRLNSKEA